jgi:hypothetical protein
MSDTRTQAPAGMEPNYCNAEQCTCRMGFGYVACDQQPKWKRAAGVKVRPAYLSPEACAELLEHITELRNPDGVGASDSKTLDKC